MLHFNSESDISMICSPTDVAAQTVARNRRGSISSTGADTDPAAAAAAFARKRRQSVVFDQNPMLSQGTMGNSVEFTFHNGPIKGMHSDS